MSEPRHGSFYDRLLVDEQFILLRQESGDTPLSIYLYIIDLIKQWQDEGRNEGREEGIQQERMTVAQNLLANGVDIQIIAKSTELSIKQLQDLQSKMRDQ